MLSNPTLGSGVECIHISKILNLFQRKNMEVHIFGNRSAFRSHQSQFMRPDDVWFESEKFLAIHSWIKCEMRETAWLSKNNLKQRQILLGNPFHLTLSLHTSWNQDLRLFDWWWPIWSTITYPLTLCFGDWWSSNLFTQTFLVGKRKWIF